MQMKLSGIKVGTISLCERAMNSFSIIHTEGHPD